MTDKSPSHPAPSLISDEGIAALAANDLDVMVMADGSCVASPPAPDEDELMARLLAPEVRYYQTNDPGDDYDTAKRIIPPDALRVEAASRITALKAEVVQLRAERDEECRWVERYAAEDAKTRDAIGEQFTLVLPDGGDVKTWEAVAALRDALKAENAELRAHLGALQEEARDTGQAFQRAADFNLRHNTATAYARGFNDARDAAVAWHTAEIAVIEKQIEANNEYRLSQNKSVYCDANDLCHSSISKHRRAATAIASLKPKEH